MECNYLISRQPVFGKQLNVLGYEVRTCPIVESGPETDPASTERALFTMFTDSMLDDIVGNNNCFINLTATALAEDLWKLLPQKRIVYAIPEPVSVDTLNLFQDRAHVIRVDAIAYAPADLEKRVEELRSFNAKLLAGNVDTYDDLEFCQSLSFDFFQGRFVSRSASQGKEVPVSRLALMRILAKLQQSDLEMSDLEKIISQDVSLSFKLLRYANSAAVGLPRKVSGVGHAVRLLGIDTLRNWTRVLLMSAVEDKPRELMTIALVRGRMCERLSEHVKNAQKEAFFSAGLLSVLDALLDCPMEKALAELPLVDEVRAALISKAGQIGQALRCTLAYERADWDDVQFYGLPPLPIRDIYMDAISWAQQVTGGLLA